MSVFQHIVTAVSVVAIAALAYGVGEAKGQIKALQEKNLLIMSVACEDKRLEEKLLNIDIPESWELAKLLEKRPDAYEDVVEGIVHQCPSVLMDL